MTASKGLRPALLFLSSGAGLTTPSISARKLSKGTTVLSASSGSPLALIASRRLSRSKKPGCPTAFPRAADAGTRESDLRGARQCYFSRCPYGTTFIRLSPRGLDQTILAHEFSHVELHARIGQFRLLMRAIPAWFDEGLAVIVSDDARYLGPGTMSATRCLVEPRGDLPSNPSQWGHAAGKTPGLYAQAACRVMRWMEENGGKTGLRDAISQIADGRRRLP